MKNIQARVNESVDEFIFKLQTLIGEFAAAAIAEGLPHQRKKKRVASARYRSPAAILVLADGLYAEICAHPGATMQVLSKGMGEDPKSLAVPARKLLNSGKAKKTGERAETRYFPVGRQSRLKAKGSVPPKKGCRKRLGGK